MSKGVRKGNLILFFCFAKASQEKGNLILFITA